MTRTRAQEGFTLVELLVAIVLALVVFGGVMTLLEVALRQSQADDMRNTTQDAARSAIDRLSRDMRNVASPTAGAAGALEQASNYDIVFQTVSANQVFGGSNASNQMRVRYCLDASTPSNETLWLQTQTWTTATPPAIPTTSACPSSDPGWASKYSLLTNITNENGGQNRPIFVYAPLTETGTSQIDGVDVDLFMTPQSTDPSEIELRSGIYLRNSNSPPTASFSVSQINGHVILNASGSSDPQGQVLTYQWTLNGATIPGATTQTYDAGNYTSGSSQTFGLTVADTGGLTATTSQVVTIQ